MKFIYEDKSTTTLGYTFEDGKPTEVTDERAIGKLRANPAFREAGLVGEVTQLEREAQDTFRTLKIEAMREIEAEVNEVVERLETQRAEAVNLAVEAGVERDAVTELLKLETERAVKAEEALAAATTPDTAKADPKTKAKAKA